jgi:hypothetical protein
MRSVNALPGFTAEAAVYKTAHNYSVAAIDVDSSRQVVPQIPMGLCNKASYYCNRGYEKWCDILDRICLEDF